MASTFYTGALQTTTYRIPRYRFEACRVFTNKPPCGPKRGHGTPQPRFGQEVQLDKIAEALAVDPGELRLRIVEAPDALTANYMRLGTVGSYTPPASPARYKGGGVGPSPTYSYTAAVVEVEVDRATGWVSVRKVWVAHDIGRAINPTLARGQVEGSVYMALGEALMEEQTFRRLPAKLSNALVHKFPSILEYKSPTSLDMPEVVKEFVGSADPHRAEAMTRRACLDRRSKPRPGTHAPCPGSLPSISRFRLPTTGQARLSRRNKSILN